MTLCVSGCGIPLLPLARRVWVTAWVRSLPPNSEGSSRPRRIREEVSTRIVSPPPFIPFSKIVCAATQNPLAQRNAHG